MIGSIAFVDKRWQFWSQIGSATGNVKIVNIKNIAFFEVQRNVLKMASNVETKVSQLATFSVAMAYLICGEFQMTIPASLESKTLYAVCTVLEHCTKGQKMKAAVLAALKAGIPPTTSPTTSNPNDADVNRYICWTTAILLIAACFWNSSWPHTLVHLSVFSALLF